MLKQDSYKQHISQQFNAELEGVKDHMLEMGGKVEKQVGDALAALVNMDTGDADLVITLDREINALEVSIDEECSRILALRQPAASDLRLLLAITKVTTDLERVGDEAVKIARQSMRMAEEGISPSNYVEIRNIGQRVTAMLRNSLDAFARLDVQMAVDVVLEDREVDQEYSSAMRSLVTFMMEDPRSIGAVLTELWALRSLERVGDHASNIAEHVVYLVKGLDVRHVDIAQLVGQIAEEGDGLPSED